MSATTYMTKYEVDEIMADMRASVWTENMAELIDHINKYQPLVFVKRLRYTKSRGWFKNYEVCWKYLVYTSSGDNWDQETGKIKGVGGEYKQCYLYERADSLLEALAYLQGRCDSLAKHLQSKREVVCSYPLNLDKLDFEKSDVELFNAVPYAPSWSVAGATRHTSQEACGTPRREICWEADTSREASLVAAMLRATNVEGLLVTVGVKK
jgi:hypothetical protein